MVKNRSFILESSSRKNSQTQLKWRSQLWRAPDRSTNQTKQRILCVRAVCCCQSGIQNMFSMFSGLSTFNYGGNNFNFCNQFTKTLLFPASWHGWKMAKNSWEPRELGPRWIWVEWWKESGIPDLGGKWSAQYVVLESGRKWTKSSLCRALACYESKY